MLWIERFTNICSHSDQSDLRSRRRTCCGRRKRAMGTVGAGGEVSPLIRIGGLQKIYAANTASPVHALSSIDLDIADGEFVAVVGPSGCGKSTLLRILAGLDDHDGGDLTLAGQ